MLQKIESRVSFEKKAVSEKTFGRGSQTAMSQMIINKKKAASTAASRETEDEGEKYDQDRSVYRDSHKINMKQRCRKGDLVTLGRKEKKKQWKGNSWQ